MIDSKSTEELRNEVQEIVRAVRDGTLSTTIARTLLLGAKITLDSVKMEMEAARLGSSFSAVRFAEAERNKSSLKRVA
jgi:hypothetical protein